MNAYGNAINLMATTDAIELISLDFPKLNIRKEEYGYDLVARERLGLLLTKAMLRVLELPLLESLKASDHILTAEENLKSKVDEDKMFRDLDKSVYSCSLGPPMSPP